MATVAPRQPKISSPRRSGTLPLHRITVDEYERIIEAGALEDPSRVELIDGEMVDKMAKGAGHGFTTKKLLRALDSRLPSGWTWQKEEPVRIPDFDEPEPDVAVVRGSRDDYRDRIPEPKDIALVVEVADSTLDRDQGKKWDAYARGRIAVYWIVNLAHRRVEVYTDPGPAGYDSCQFLTTGQEVPVAIDGAVAGRIAVADILPSTT
jgi:Uma2 family endonuclease